MNSRVFREAVQGAALCVFLLVLFSSCCFALPSVENVKPQITAVFEEKVVLVRYFLVNEDTRQEFPVTVVSEQDGLSFVFMPSKSLQNGNYVFTLFASDLVGNTESYNYEFQVFVPGTRIFLVEPNSIGFANETTFRVAVYSSRPSVCKYTGISVPSFDDVRLKIFDQTGSISDSTYANDHVINSYSVEPDFPRRLYVVCRDDLGRENFADFLLYSDLTPPTLTGVFFSPSPLVEYPPEGDLFSVLKVSASEPVQCRYTEDAEAAYEAMVAFDGFDINSLDAYHDVNQQQVDFPGVRVKEAHDFYVQCEDRARMRSARVLRPLSIDMTEGLMIRVLSPPAMSRNTSVFLNISTNRRAYCLYKSADPGDPSSFADPRAQLSSSFESLATEHWKPLGARSSGSHTLSIHCEVPEGVGLEAMKADIAYTYVIDTSPPFAPKVNATSPVCTNTLTASFVANDSQTGISEYRWAVGSAGKSFANGTTTSTSVSVSSYANGSSLVLASGQQYAFSVSAVDGAGNVGPAAPSNNIVFDATGTSCDKTPPVVTLVRSESGDSVSIECADAQSNCSSSTSFYGTSYVQPCNWTLYYLNPVIIPLFRTTIVCWSIKDNAGNVNSGSQVVDYNLSSAAPGVVGALCPGGVDNDGDGYGERCAGPDCDDTNSSIAVGCASGCIQDADGDGYGFGCAAGNDCNDRKKELTTSCPNGCVSDNDGDEFGIACNNGPDCKGDDSALTTNCPNGCVDDNDGDSYGLLCPVDWDCHGDDKVKMKGCGTLCIQDTDGDGYGMGCTAGLDCNGRNPKFMADCANGCVFDEDGDSYGFGCLKGLDCNGADYFTSSGCANGCLSDNDGDGYGWRCGNGADCNDTDPYVNLDCRETTDCRYDHDGDGYGLGCAPGYDCDDYDALRSRNCTENCTYDVDCNGLPDEWQELYFNSTVCNDALLCGPDADPDGDGYSNIEEYRQDTDPMQKDVVQLPAEVPSQARDEDGDNMPDACERMYGLNPSDPFDAGRDNDGDGLENSFECRYTEGRCANTWLNPNSPDTDNDGYSDSEEIDAATDPCDPDSKPSAGLIPIILIILGLLMHLGSTGYIIYKKYYVPLVSPPKPTAVPRAAPSAARPGGAPLPGAQPIAPRRFAPHRPAGPAMSKERFDEEMKRRADERERILNVFGTRKEIPRPSKVMEQIAKRPVEQRKAGVEKAAPVPAHAAKIAKVVGEDYVDKIASLTKEQADYFGRLAVITKRKEVPLEEDQVAKLAAITKRVSEDGEKSRELEQAFRKSDMDKLDDFLTSGKRVDTFIKEYATGESKDLKKGDSFEELAKVGEGKKGIDALSELSRGKRDDVMAALNEMSSRRGKEAALSKMEQLSSLGSKEELFKAFSQMSKEKHVDKNVFEVLLSYLLKSGKITRHDVSEILLMLESQGVLDKKDVSDVFFNMGMKK